ncbi:hypothetical protein CCC_02284 [Paramagnetospirillum magnetotacticum MS-1]|uniref:Uncharacterized protein n=1 Tax=Paramagnetospirillum magnetotacticum MS-1 TaxID=272627 RepID=A0A0C2YGD5_PARME|nr:hypothetical protein [Paramagnetospirillum magnetotacticum]KIL98834.1 hypothetical protein CCC_02284 [Paramagnetospirillum magnetotacticum MS-1]
MPNKATVAARQAAEEAAKRLAEVMGAEAENLTAHGLLVSVYRCPTLPLDMRIDAAKAALKSETVQLHALAASVNQGDIGKLVEERMAEAKAALTDMAARGIDPISITVTDDDGIPLPIAVNTGMPAFRPLPDVLPPLPSPTPAEWTEGPLIGAEPQQPVLRSTPPREVTPIDPWGGE